MKRFYSQFCPIARGLDLVGERWTLLLLRELLTGPKRYKELQSRLGGIGTNLLAERLNDLESAGLISKRMGSFPAYELTDLGRSIEPTIMGLGRWGGSFLDGPFAEDQTSAMWLVLAMKANFRRERFRKGTATFEFRVGEETVSLYIDGDEVLVREEPAREPDVLITTQLLVLTELLRGDVNPREALQSGSAVIVGDRTLFQQLFAATRRERAV